MPVAPAPSSSRLYVHRKTNQSLGERCAHHVVRAGSDVIDRVRAIAPEGVHHIVEVALGANVATDLELLALDGSIAAYATDAATPAIPFWPLLFKNIRGFFIGSHDFPPGRGRIVLVF